MKHLLIFLASIALSLLINFFAPVSAQLITPSFSPAQWDFYDCPADVTTGPEEEFPPAALKAKFPFDLIYPINPQDLDVDTQCLATSLWGTEREMCAPMQVAKIAKDIFLLKVVLQSLLSL